MLEEKDRNVMRLRVSIRAKEKEREGRKEGKGSAKKARYGDHEILKSTRRRRKRRGGEKRIATMASAISTLRLFLRLAFGMERLEKDGISGMGFPSKKKKKKERKTGSG